MKTAIRPAFLITASSSLNEPGRHRVFMNLSMMRYILFAFSTFVLLATAAGQGSLTPPPGTPAPIFKTLQQVEPRIDLQNAPASAVTTTDADFHFIITQPGSYYLSANVGVTKLNGIQVNAEGVTLDLRGFEVSRASGSNGVGIQIAGTAHRTSIFHGSIKGFASGVVIALNTTPRGCAFRDLSFGSCGTSLQTGPGATVESCRVENGNGGSNGAGLWIGTGSVATNCTVTASNFAGASAIRADDGVSLTGCVVQNTTCANGILTGAKCTLSNCDASFNTADVGIRAGAGNSLHNCSAGSNTSAAAVSSGFLVDFGSSVIHCTARENSSSAASATATTGMGFDLAGNALIQDCVASSNKGDGIRVSGACSVVGNHSGNNGSNGDGAGIHVINGDNRVEGNLVRLNDRGFDVDSGGNFIARNIASGDTTPWDVAAGNVILVVAGVTNAPFTGTSGGAPPGSTDPNANYTF